MIITDLLSKKREAIIEAARRHGAWNMRVFGSVARGEDMERSDVDFLVEFEPGRSLADHASLIPELQEIIGRDVDVISEKGLRDRLRESVMSEATPL